MEKVNYNSEMLKIVSGFSAENKPSLLLHCCCGPCATAVIERLTPFFRLSLYYFNPNTRPYAEYLKRLDTLNEYLEKSRQAIPVIVGEYDA